MSAPAADDAAAAALAADLGAAGFTVQRLDELWGPVARAALHRESPLPAVRALDGRDEPAATLARLWVLGLPVTRAALDAALPVTTTAASLRRGRRSLVAGVRPR